MILIDDMKNALDIILHPAKKTGQSMDIMTSLMLYYKVVLIPGIIYIILGAVFAQNALSTYSATLGGLGIVLVIIFTILAIFIIYPIGLLISAGLYHIVGSVFGLFKRGYANTFAAVIYGIMPVLLLIWLFPIPILGTIVAIIAGLWGLIVEILALSKQQNTSVLAAVGVVVATWIVIFIIVFIIVLIIGAVFGAALLSGMQGLATTTI